MNIFQEMDQSTYSEALNSGQFESYVPAKGSPTRFLVAGDNIIFPDTGRFFVGRFGESDLEEGEALGDYMYYGDTKISVGTIKALKSVLEITRKLSSKEVASNSDVEGIWVQHEPKLTEVDYKVTKDVKYLVSRKGDNKILKVITNKALGEVMALTEEGINNLKNLPIDIEKSIGPNMSIRRYSEFKIAVGYDTFAIQDLVEIYEEG